MTDHAHIKEKIFALYDGELVGEARLEAETHLKECAECQALFEGWSKTAKTLFREPQPLESEFFVRRVMEQVDRLNAPAPPPMRRRYYLRWLVPAISLATLFLVMRQPIQQPVSVETLLPTMDEVLDFGMEE